MKRKIIVVSGSIFIIILLFFKFFYNNQKDIELVRIFYLPHYTHLLLSIDSCEKLFNYSDILRDTIIRDEKFINSYSKLVSKLKISDSTTNMDFRIRCVSKNKRGDKEVLCLDSYSGIMYNGVKMEDNPELRKLIMDVINISSQNKSD